MLPNEPDVNSQNQFDLLKVRLNQKGQRLTNQRQKILDVFSNALEGQHLSAEEIHHQVIQQGDRISYSTIYRALHTMVDLGILREVELAEGRKYYELSSPFAHQHHHLVCVQCGEVQEFEDSRVTKVSQRETVGHGFLMQNCQFTVYGICRRCQQNAFN
jgi:Fur family ferric uptake transcriptional regulator